MAHTPIYLPRLANRRGPLSIRRKAAIVAGIGVPLALAGSILGNGLGLAAPTRADVLPSSPFADSPAAALSLAGVLSQRSAAAPAPPQAGPQPPASTAPSQPQPQIASPAAFVRAPLAVQPHLPPSPAPTPAPTAPPAAPKAAAAPLLAPLPIPLISQPSILLRISQQQQAVRDKAVQAEIRRDRATAERQDERGNRFRSNASTNERIRSD